MTQKVLDKTESLCPVCLKRIKANIILKDNKVLISKNCSEHGKFECFHAWDDPILYKEFMEISKKKMNFTIDSTIDITSKCNMNCPFCFSGSKGKSYEPSIETLIKKAKSWGQGSILLYGGEPTMRKDLPEIIKEIKNTGLDVHILSNGLKLDKDFVEKLDSAGLERVQLQLDSLDDKINLKLRNQKLVNHKLDAIKNLSDTNIDLTFFVVLVKGYNENQIGEILNLAADNCGKIVTVIFTPVSPEGISNKFKITHMNNSDMFERIDDEFGIKKEDFIVCSKFDVSFSNFLYNFGNIKRRSIAPCEALCYILVKNSKLIPLNRLIDLKKLSDIFDGITKSKTKNRFIMASNLLFQCIKKKVNVKLEAIPFLIDASLSVVVSFIAGKTAKKKFKQSFGLIVNPSQDRYNADYNFIEKCNLYSDTTNGEFITFCENNILSTGPKKFKSLNFDMIAHHEK